MLSVCYVYVPCLFRKSFVYVMCLLCVCCVLTVIILNDELCMLCAVCGHVWVCCVCGV